MKFIGNFLSQTALQGCDYRSLPNPRAVVCGCVTRNSGCLLRRESVRTMKSMSSMYVFMYLRLSQRFEILVMHSQPQYLPACMVLLSSEYNKYQKNTQKCSKKDLNFFRSLSSTWLGARPREFKAGKSHRRAAPSVSDTKGKKFDSHPRRHLSR